MMKKLSALLFLATLSLSATAQTTHIKVRGSRVEMTTQWDAQVSQADIQHMNHYKGHVDSIMRPVEGRSARFMKGGRPESLLSNLLADILLAEAPRHGGADFAVINVGGIRSTLPEGPITYGHLFNISPFENRFTIVTMTAHDVQALFTQIASVGGEGLSGARLEITPTGQLLKAQVQGQPLDPQRQYRIATLDYLSEGNDKMLAFKRAVKKEVSDLLVRDILINHVRTQQRQGHLIDSQFDGRITLVNP